MNIEPAAPKLLPGCAETGGAAPPMCLPAPPVSHSPITPERNYSAIFVCRVVWSSGGRLGRASDTWKSTELQNDRPSNFGRPFSVSGNRLSRVNALQKPARSLFVCLSILRWFAALVHDEKHSSEVNAACAKN